ncbi:MAG: transposase family protein, partial [Gammaproteobacteria bacterium]|nr:transposase family protein [Gammaproteobacteria bacterium]
FLFAYPIPRETAQVIGKTLVNKFFWAFGLPRELLTDRGSAFISDLFQQLEACYQIKHLFTTSCHPQTDGLVERANRTLVNSMAKLLAEYDSTWEDLLGSFLLSYNMSVHASTLISPYAAMFGREGRRPSASLLSKRPSPYAWSLEHWIDQLPHYLHKMWKVVKENAQKAQRLYAKQFDKNKKGHQLQVGERVLWFRPQDLSGDDRKFALPFVGPYIVTELLGPNNVYIRLENSTQEPFLVNVDQLSRCYAGLSLDGPLQFTHTVRPHRANRKRRAIVKAQSQHSHPHHQMQLR